MNRIDSLRLQGYATDSNGHILCRAGVESRVHDRDGWGLAATPQAERYEQTWLAIVRVDVAHGDARKISDALIVAADSPRALVGKRRDGSAVLVFKSAPPAARPSTSQMVSMPRF